MTSGWIKKDLAMVLIAVLGLGAMIVFKESQALMLAITGIAALATGRKKNEKD